jgi:hypothetical protein
MNIRDVAGGEQAERKRSAARPGTCDNGAPLEMPPLERLAPMAFLLRRFSSLAQKEFAPMVRQ